MSQSPFKADHSHRYATAFRHLLNMLCIQPISFYLPHGLLSFLLLDTSNSLISLLSMIPHSNLVVRLILQLLKYFSIIHCFKVYLKTLWDVRQLKCGLVNIPGFIGIKWFSFVKGSSTVLSYVFLAPPSSKACLM